MMPSRAERTVADFTTAMSTAAKATAAMVPTAYSAVDMPASARRMLLVACAMARKPQVLLLDEPTVGLDTAGYGWLARVMRAYADQDNRAVLWTCHDARFASQVSDLRIDMAG
mgnify:CR=1 FL=1